MTLPSKELLSAVLKINEVNIVYIEGNDIDITTYSTIVKGSDTYNINIYELMHMMKEWILKQGMYIAMHNTNINSITLYRKESRPKVFSEGTEFELTTKACEWILKDNHEKE